MGGKSTNTPAPPAVTAPPPADTGQIEAMMAMMSQMMSAQPQAPQLPPMPTIQREPEVDWTKKVEELQNKAKADYTLDKARKTGRSDTVLTSPLLEESETTDKSLITG